MTDAKRLNLTTISNSVTSSLFAAGTSANLRFGVDLLSQTSSGPSSNGKGSSKTIRLNIELFETDSVKYPEFNYAKLLHLEKKKLKKLKQKSNGFSDPFEDNDDDVARIAKELERKYGNAYSSGRGKNKRDDIDIGMGYDESDSFIDNTEAYDELIPDEVETIEGGFYINCGALEFKKLYTESYTTKTDEIIKMPNRPKKRVISSSSEESSSSGEEEEEDDDSEDEEDDEDSGEESSVETSKSKSSTSTKDKKLKSTANNPAKKKTILPENGGILKKSKEKNLPSTLTCSASSSPKVPAEETVSDIERNVKIIEKTTTVKDMLKAQRDNFLKSQTNSNGETKEKSSAEDDEDDDSSSDDSEDDDGDEDDTGNNTDSTTSTSQTQKDKKPASGAEDYGNEKLRISDTNLPELEPDVLQSIVEFRDGVKAHNLIGKKFQFDDKLSETFLKIDDSLLCIEKTQRNMVFAHLEFQLSLPKYYFLRKAKQLRIKEEKLKSKRAFNKLQKAITDTISAVISSYDAELRRYNELLSANPNNDHPPKMPKKKFPWNTNLRNLLYDVYQVRWTSYPVLGTRKETLEEFITSYMRDKVVDIWPKGWMRYEELQKEIERRKMAAKKAKEKKKVTSGTTSGQSSPNPSIVNNMTSSMPSVPASALTVAGTGISLPNATTLTTQPVSLAKQFEEFATRSNANSDTDSVASSNTSSGLKRKSTETNRNKPPKAKSAKLNGDHVKPSGSNNTSNRNLNVISQPTISVDLVTANKRTDHSINHIIMLSNDGSVIKNNAAPTSLASSIFSAATAALSQPSKHSSNTHVIDLDNYKSVGDILQTSKEIQAAATAAVSSSTSLTKTNALSIARRRESSGDSEIEIVGVYPAKQQSNKRHKTNSRSSTPNSNNNATTDKTSLSTYNSNNNNRKKSSTNSHAVLTSQPGMDVNKMVSALMELGDNLQIKPVLATSTKQQQSQSSNQTTASTSLQQ